MGTTGSRSPVQLTDPESNQSLLIDGRRHVLLNNLILDKIAKHLRPGDLLRLRRTATGWNRVFIPELKRRHAPIKLPRNVSLSHYIEVMKASTEVPFRRYELQDALMVNLEQKLLDEFFALWGDHISSLKFDWIHGPSWKRTVGKFRRAVFQLTPKLEDLSITLRSGAPAGPQSFLQEEVDQSRIAGPLPSLKRLQLLDWQIEILPMIMIHNTHFFILIDDLIRNATGLVQIECGITWQHTSWNYRVLESLRDFAPALKKLKVLKIQSAHEADVGILVQLGHLKEGSLRLDEFVISIWHQYSYGDINRYIDLLNSFLVTQSSTLANLELNFEDVGTYSARPGSLLIELPQMVDLRDLRLVGDLTGSIRLYFKWGSLEETLPSLRSLRLSWNLMEEITKLHGHDDGGLDPFDTVAHSRVTELVLTDVHFGHGSERTRNGVRRLEEFGRRFPALTRLEMHDLGTHIPRCIKVFWPGLSVLSLDYRQKYYSDGPRYPPLELDEWLTGIDKSRFLALESDPVFHRIKTAKLKGGDDNESGPEKLRILRNISAKFKTLPGLSDLSYLKSFTLNMVGGYCNLTDIGGYLGLALSSPSVDRMVILIRTCTGHPEQFISTDCRSLIWFALGPEAEIQIDSEVKREAKLGRLAKLGSCCSCMNKS